ncbi:MAG: Rrf2 family transcriptional regulator [Alphaproteobacteria bacterium]|jgi:Rrf2 family iron-sulfur cluster assembly transcriptional regulator|nr:Rrf2 family transcriptional regulator [Thalassospira sp.]MCE2965507.1 Rrf2 family transcriptional regulator [Alphaproteobacteria bacterium]
MLYIAPKVQLAISSVLDIAYNIADRPVPSQIITARHQVPRRYLEPLLQQLVRDGILLSARGPKGGYRLARERSAISLGDIARSISLIDTAIMDAPTELSARVLTPIWERLSRETLATLDTLTLQHLCDAAHRQRINSEIRATLDFTI